MPKPKKTLNGVMRILFRAIERRSLDLQMDVAAYYGSATDEEKTKLDAALTSLRRDLDDIALGQYDPLKHGFFDDQH